MPATTTYLPSREAELLTWTEAFNANLVANQGPAGDAFGLDLGQISAYTAAQSLFASTYQAANQNNTRTPLAIQQKNDAKTALISLTREYASFIQENPATTDADRALLQLPIHDADPTPIDPPSTKPVMTVTDIQDRTVKFILRNDGEPDKRAKPDGVTNAVVLTYVGDTAPVNASDWSMGGVFGKTSCEITFPGTVPAFSKVWLASYWINRKGDAGPLSTPVSTNIADGLAEAA